MEKNEVINIVQNTIESLSPEGVRQQINLIQQIMHDVMKEGEHFGTIPGTKKPTLYKAGAEKLCLTFRLSPQYTVLSQIQEKDFIVYTVKCTLRHINTGEIIAEGIGACNSRENKYRYQFVASDKKPSKKEAEELKAKGLGRWKKSGNKWIWTEKVENDNPWDLDNTYIKMACKRSLVAATLNATAASDIFTQDLEELEIPETPQDEEPSVTIEDISTKINSKLKKVFHTHKVTSPEIIELWIKHEGNQETILEYFSKQTKNITDDKPGFIADDIVENSSEPITKGTQPKAQKKQSSTENISLKEMNLTSILPMIEKNPPAAYRILKLVRGQSLRSWDQLNAEELEKAYNLFLESEVNTA